MNQIKLKTTYTDNVNYNPMTISFSLDKLRHLLEWATKCASQHFKPLWHFTSAILYPEIPYWYIKRVLNLDRSADWSTCIVSWAILQLPSLSVEKCEIPKNRISLQTSSRMAAVSCFIFGVRFSNRQRSFEIGYTTSTINDILYVGTSYCWLQHLWQKVVHFAWLTKIGNRA